MLDDDLIASIIDESLEVLERIGVYVENAEAVHRAGDAGANVDSSSRRVFFPRRIVEAALATAPHEITMYDTTGEASHVVGGDRVHFDPGSAALTLFDHTTQTEREAQTADVVRFVRLTEKLDGFHFQSTGLISRDVAQEVSDCYRLYLGLMFSRKPIVTGLFIVDGFTPMAAMLKAVRGSSEDLRRKPLAIFDACPSPPLKWSNLTTQSVIECARAGIPSELVAMPLTGATSPVTLTGALVQHAAENLAGLVIAQLACPGAPVIFGGSPASFDLRTGHAPMGAVETMMIDSAYAQIGKRLGLPTHAYMGLSDAKSVDAQAGAESGIGAVIAALSGINVVSGGGMLDYETCQSLEKLVIDNDICGMAYRLIDGITQRESPMALDLFKELAHGLEFITHPHTLKWYRKEQFYPAVSDRGTYQQWVDAGKLPLAARASKRVAALLADEARSVLPTDTQAELESIMLSHARRFGMPALPGF